MAYYKCGSVYTTQNSNVGINAASGDIASFQTNLAMALQKLKIAFSASQDLHGYDHPWPAGGEKNLFDQSYNNLFPYTNTHTETYYVDFCRFIPDIILEANVTYTLSFDINTTVTPFNISVGVGDTSYRQDIKTAVNLQNGRVSITFTPTAEQLSSYNKFAFRAPRYGSPTTFTTIVNNVMLEKSSTATSFEPYSNICPLTGFSQANVARCSTNLWDEEWESGTYNSENGQSSPSANAIRSKNRIAIRAGLTYAFYNNTANAQIRLYYYDKSGTFLSYEAKNAVDNVATFTTPENASFVNFAIGNSTTPVTTNNQNLSINYPSTDMTYHAYHGNTYLLQFGDTYYGCEIDVVHGKLRVLWGGKIYDGSNDEDWQRYGIDDYHGYRISISDMKSGSNQFGYCNYLKVQNATNETGIRLGASNNNFAYLFHVYDTIPDLNNDNSISTWRTYLSTHNLEVVYPLATPIEVDIDSAIITALTGEVNQVYCDIPTSTVDLEYKVVNL